MNAKFSMRLITSSLERGDGIKCKIVSFGVNHSWEYRYEISWVEGHCLSTGSIIRK